MTPSFFPASAASVGPGLARSVWRCCLSSGAGLAVLAAAPLPLLAQPTPSPEAVAEACRSGQVATLPLPFPDLQRDHWAFESVMRLYYGCVVHENQPTSASSTSPPTAEADEAAAASSDRAQ
jgi:hypothetical protein